MKGFWKVGGCVGTVYKDGGRGGGGDGDGVEINSERTLCSSTWHLFFSAVRRDRPQIRPRPSGPCRGRVKTSVINYAERTGDRSVHISLKSICHQI